MTSSIAKSYCILQKFKIIQNYIYIYISLSRMVFIQILVIFSRTFINFKIYTVS